MPECNIDDILCEIEVLRSMRSLRTAVGTEIFKSEFPELEGIDEKLVNKIQSTEGSIKEALAKCGNISLEEAGEDILEGDTITILAEEE